MNDKKKSYDRGEFNREADGLKQRRLKNDSRRKFNPNGDYKLEDDNYEDDEFTKEDIK